MSKRSRTGHDLSEDFGGWLWDEYGVIPRDELSMIVGSDGMGKSTFALKLAAEMTQGTLSGRKEVVFASMAEDGEPMTKGRLIVFGADLDRMRVQPTRPDGLPDDLWVFPDRAADFEKYLIDEGVTVAILDSADIHIGNITHQSARKTLAQLHLIAQHNKITIILVHHTNKTGKNLDTAIGGGRGVKAAMRCILVWGERPQTQMESMVGPFKDDDDDEDEDDKDPRERGTHVLAVHKNSYGQKFPQKQSLTYQKREEMHPFDGRETLLAFDYECEAPTSPDQIFFAKEKEVASSHDRERQADRAQKLIIGYLAAAGDWVPATELMQHVMAAGISKRNVAEARSQLRKAGDIAEKREGNQHWWRIDIPDAPPMQ